ncbi:BlaI/MecI/CopY family transcriptional regulator [Kitasatospora sp. NPDC051853]|uniref:BlaI/MecI/CopY family transcriptional regulator n=1 Tax=Kitasatospora sp. NPDC051853 TaxID=3364058 RepID=UPI00378B4D83
MADGPEEGRRPHGELVGKVLTALWAADQPLTPRQVRSAVGPELARTTVATILARLHEQGKVVRSRAADRGFAYAAADDAAGLAAGRMRRELDREPQRGLVLERFVSSLPAEDGELLRRLLLAAGHG